MKTLVTYVPHGINQNMYYPITPGDIRYDLKNNEETKLKDGNLDKFVVFWNNRNIHRKHPSDLILAFKVMCDKIDARDPNANAKENCILLMHTKAVDENGTNLIAVSKDLCKGYKILFSEQDLPSEHLNIMYNVVDVTVNISSNEGFGLTSAESLMAGTPIIVNVTGGLQDQCGFINPDTGTYFTENDYLETFTLHSKSKWKHLKHGSWVKPVWPSNLSLQGSIPTPYIFDDRASYEDIADMLLKWYDMPKDERKAAGLAGREYLLDTNVGMSAANMCERIIESIDSCLDTFTVRQPYNLFKV